MNLLKRNKKSFSYKLFLGKTEIEDKNGNKTGVYEAIYDNPVSCSAHFFNSGVKYKEMFGSDFDFNAVVWIENLDSPITQNSIIITDDGTKYEVLKKIEYYTHSFLALKSLRGSS